MSLALDADRTYVARLRLRGRCADPALAKLRASTALSSATLSPPAFAPGAILVVRSVKDPLPGRLAVKNAGVQLPPEWEQAVRSQIAAATQRALRPLREAVPDSAEAVLFADESELLACLARDWVRGAGARWWWRALFRDADLATAVIRAWRERPGCVPAALHHLRAEGDDAIVAGALGHDVIVTLLHAVTTTYGLTELGAALAPLLEGRAAGGETAGGATATPPRRARAHDLNERVDPPWFHRLPAHVLPAGLTPLREALLGVCLSLAEAPQSARTSAYAAWVRDWAKYRLQSESERIDPLLDAHPPPPACANRDLPVAIDAPGAISPEATPAIPRGHGQPVSDGRPAAVSVDTATLPQSATRAYADPTARNTLALPPVTHEAAAAKRAGNESCVDTEWGGVLFLVNLALFLDLYGDFANPERAGIEVPIWDFAALVAENLAGPALRKDPIWSLLAELSGRSAGENPGARFRPQSHWRMPVSWLQSAAPGALAQAWIRRGRLQVLHSAGFALLDLPLRHGHARAQLAREIAPYIRARVIDEAGLPSLVQTPRSTGGGSARTRGRRAALAQWLRWMLPFLRHRLATALGVHRVEEVAPLLLRRAARVYVTRTRVDVRFSLAELPLEVRLAGLDRDPGWVPAAGRTIHFHFD